MIAVLLLLRLSSLGFAPLFDSTEGRYAEIGREMVRTGDWVTPRLGTNDPYLSKPPLHFWMTALSLRAFGLNEFAARLPGFLSLLAMLALTALLARKLYGRRAAAWSVLVLLTSPLVYVGAACVMTDITLAACVTGIMVFMILALRAVGSREAAGWGAAMFACAGLGILAKGPLAVVLGVLAAGFWLAFTRKIAPLRRLPWAGGVALAGLICLPWFIMVEIRNPGFLKYYIVNEHLLRFFKRDFGDLQGKEGHVHFFGSIWVMWLGCFLQWTPLLILVAWRALRLKSWRRLACDGDAALLAGWALAPLALFTFSRSVILTYLLPGLPPMAILIGWLLAPDDSGRSGMTVLSGPSQPLVQRLLFWTALVLLAGGVCEIIYIHFMFHLTPAEIGAGLAMVAILCLGLVRQKISGVRIDRTLCLAAIAPCFALYFSCALGGEFGGIRSSYALVAAISRTPALSRRMVVFYDDAPYSAHFYLDGRLRSLKKDRRQLPRVVADQEILVVDQQQWRKLPPQITKQFKIVLICDKYEVLEPARQ